MNSLKLAQVLELTFHKDEKNRLTLEVGAAYDKREISLPEHARQVLAIRDGYNAIIHKIMDESTIHQSLKDTETPINTPKTNLEIRVLYSDLAYDTDELHKRKDLTPTQIAQESVKLRHDYLSKINDIINPKTIGTSKN